MLCFAPSPSSTDLAQKHDVFAAHHKQAQRLIGVVLAGDVAFKHFTHDEVGELIVRAEVADELATVAELHEDALVESPGIGVVITIIIIMTIIIIIIMTIIITPRRLTRRGWLRLPSRILG